MRKRIPIACLVAAMLTGATLAAAADKPADMVRLKDITSVEGVRGNPLIGYGVVVGLA